MKIIIGKKVGTFDDEDFERIIGCAASSFVRLKEDEGSMFPASDKRAIAMIRELQWWFSEKTITQAIDE